MSNKSLLVFTLCFFLIYSRQTVTRVVLAFLEQSQIISLFPIKLFYIVTGFHGFHVLIGTCSLFVAFLCFITNHFTNTHILVSDMPLGIGIL